MAVYRVQKTRDYTVMANHHLRNKMLSLKAKGLLSLIFSLPDDWNYTTRGLSTICKEGVDSISAALNELERAGYIVRNRLRDKKGRIRDTEYVIYEQPISENNSASETIPAAHKPRSAAPSKDEPSPVAPCTENPDMDTSDTEKPAQSNTYISNTHKAITDQTNIYPSIHPDVDEIDRFREAVRYQVEYYELIENQSINHRQLDEIIELITDVLCATKPVINLGGEDYHTEVVKSRFKKLNAEHIENLMINLQHTKNRIRNIRNYILKALYNATFTTESQNCADANYQYYGGGKLWT